MIKWVIVPTLLVLMADNGYGQQAAGKSSYTLNDCLSYAVRNNTGIKGQAYTNSTYRQNITGAVAALMPSVSANINALASNGRSIDPETNTYSTTSNLNNSYSLSASIQLFNGFSGFNAVRNARVMQLMGKERIQQLKDEVALKTMQAFFDVIYYAKSVSIVFEQLSNSNAILKKARKMAELGLKSDADVAQVEAQVASDELLVVQQSNARDNALLTLKAQMNYPTADSLPVDTSMISDSDMQRLNLFFIEEFALGHNPKAKVASYLQRSAQLDYFIIRGRLMPTLTIEGGYSTNYFKNLATGAKTLPYATQLSDNRGSYFGATLSIPIFNGLGRYTNVVRSRNQMRVAELNVLDAQRELYTLIRQAGMQLLGYEKEFELASRKVAAAALAYRATLEKYDKGLIDAIDLQTAANLLLLAKSQQLNTHLQYVVRYKTLEYYGGKPLVDEGL